MSGFSEVDALPCVDAIEESISYQIMYFGDSHMSVKERDVLVAVVPDGLHYYMVVLISSKAVNYGLCLLDLRTGFIVQTGACVGTLVDVKGKNVDEVGETLKGVNSNIQVVMYYSRDAVKNMPIPQYGG